jgi:hypothetical protein
MNKELNQEDRSRTEKSRRIRSIRASEDFVFWRLIGLLFAIAAFAFLMGILSAWLFD